MSVFNKPAQTIDEQLDTLRGRGLTISNPKRARHYPQFSRPHMGFPPDWEQEHFWQRAIHPKQESRP